MYLNVIDVVLSGAVSFADAGAEGTAGIKSRRRRGRPQHLVHRLSAEENKKQTLS